MNAETREYGQGPALLPVLDLKGGVVVHARAGPRAQYAPIRSPLVAGSAPVTLLGALLAVSGAGTAYIADLDAIAGPGPQFAVLAALRAAYPGLSLWLDAGFSSLAQAAALCGELQARGPGGLLLPVLGSESLAEFTDLSCAGADCVLSLDFGPEGFRGDERWLQRPAFWPQRVIVMSLAQVGVALGPDLERLRLCCTLAAEREVYAAGGVRDAQDLAALQSLGVRGALVATALHQGHLP